MPANSVSRRLATASVLAAGGLLAAPAAGHAVTNLDLVNEKLTVKHSNAGGLTTVTAQSGSTLTVNAPEQIVLGSFAADDCTISTSGTIATCTIPADHVGDLEVTLVGGSGADQFFVSLNRSAVATATLIGAGGSDTLSGSPVLGGVASNVPILFDGGAADDTMLGGAGDDEFDNGLGADRIEGGAGIDRLSYAAAAGPVTVTQDNVADDGRAGEGDRVGESVEEITLSPSADRFVAGPNAVDNVVHGIGGADQITTGAGNDTVTTAGNAGVTIDAGTGDDTVTTADGSDTIQAGDGHDVVSSGNGADTIHGGTGDDTIDAGGGRDTVFDTFGDDVLSGGGGDDRLVAGPGDDALIGGAGTDILDGGEGTTDSVSYADRPSGVHVTLDNTQNDGTAGENDQVIDVEDVVGSDHDDVLIGNAVRNHLHGGKGNDQLNGGEGADELRGGRGDDLVVGRDAGAADTSAATTGRGTSRCSTPRTWSRRTARRWTGRHRASRSPSAGAGRRAAGRTPAAGPGPARARAQQAAVAREPARAAAPGPAEVRPPRRSPRPRPSSRVS